MVERSELTPDRVDWWSSVLGPMRRFGERAAEFFAPNSEAATTDDAYEISVELPGISEQDIHVELDDRRLTISGEKRSNREQSGKDCYFSERTYGHFTRSFRLPADANPAEVHAEHKNGVLTIRVAKVVPKARDVRKISVKRG